MPVAPTEDTTAGRRRCFSTRRARRRIEAVVHTHAYTWAQRAQATHWLDAHEGDVVWCTAGTGWAKAIWNVLLGPWSHGAEVVIHDGGFDAEERLSLIQRLGVTVLCQAPTEYRLLAKLDSLGKAYLPRLRHAVSAGEPLNPEVIARFQDALGVTIHDGYGQTENSLLVANTPTAPIRPGSMGLPTTGPRRRGYRRSGPRLPGRRRGRPRPDRASTDPVHGLLERPRGDRGRIPRRLVPHRRQGRA